MLARRALQQGASTASKERKEGAEASGEPEWQSKWVVPGIIVKIMSKEKKELYKAKGAPADAVRSRSNACTLQRALRERSAARLGVPAGAVLKITRDGDKGDVVASVELDDGSEHDVHSRDLETVIPAVGGLVRARSLFSLVGRLDHTWAPGRPHQPAHRVRCSAQVRIVSGRYRGEIGELLGAPLPMA